MDFNVAELHEAIAERLTDRECFVCGSRRFTWRQFGERTRRLANLLRSHGFGVHRERATLQPWESGQDHVALYLYNGNEYLEGMLGAFKARAVPFNVNYRYVADELHYLLKDAGARAVIYHASFAPLLGAVLASLPQCELLLQVADGSGEPLLPGALDYESALASTSAARPDTTPSPDDLYMVYTGGTTGMPKGVLWRQADIFVASLGGRDRDGLEFTSMEALLERACAHSEPLRSVAAPPFMHAAAHWAALATFFAGNAVVVQNQPRRLDADDLLSTVERERASVLLIVGDAFATPILEQLERRKYDLSGLRAVVNGGAVLNAANKQALLERIPGVHIVDSIGSSESGMQGRHVSSSQSDTATGNFAPISGTCVLSDDLRRVLEPGHAELGWFARAGRIPLGYLNDAARTARTFPVIAGVTHSIPGDRARHRADGVIEVYGRDAATINSGGEKIFAEEVENVLRAQPAVYDAVVVGRPSERWGAEVVALVKLRDGVEISEAALREACARQLARYKVPKSILFLDAIVRSPSGKPDYGWAKSQLSTRSDPGTRAGR